MRDVLSGAREGKGTVSEVSYGRNNFRHLIIFSTKNRTNFKITGSSVNIKFRMTKTELRFFIKEIAKKSEGVLKKEGTGAKDAVHVVLSQSPVGHWSLSNAISQMKNRDQCFFLLRTG